MMDGRSIRVSGGPDRFQRTILGAWPAAYGPETAREAWEAVGSYDDAESYREAHGGDAGLGLAGGCENGPFLVY